MPRKEDSVPATLRAVSALEALVAAERPAALAVQAPVSRMSLERALGHLPVLRQAASAMAETFF